MAITEKTGVTFVAEDIKKYIKAFADANKAINENIKKMQELVDANKDAEKSQKSLVRLIGKTATGMKLGVSAILGFAGAITGFLGKALNIILTPIKLFVGSLRRVLEIAGGFLLRDAIQALSGLLSDMQRELMQAAADFEQLGIRMQIMISRSARLSGQIEDVAQAFDIAEGPANRMLKWVQDMALMAPISPDAITNTLTFAQTMNLSQEGAMDLTESILQFTTAMGFSSEVTERIIVNLLQMEKQGKITGREMTDLARGAMVPVNDILKDIASRMGISTEKWGSFIKEVQAGRIPVEEFITSFKIVIGRDFPEAFERMGKTLKGSIQLLKNFAKVVIGWRVLGPVAKEIGKIIGGVVEKLSTPENIKKAAAIGEVMRKSFLAIKESVTGLLKALAELAKAFGIAEDPALALAQAIITVAAFIKIGTERITKFINNLTGKVEKEFEDSSKSALSWGRNIIVSLADGMAKAITFVLRVIAQVGNILKAWFAPGSPPKIAPNLDKWGAQAMTEYMKGWLKADFSVFNEIAGLIESFIRSLPTDVLPETGIISSVLGTRQAIKNAIELVKKTGEVTEAMVNKVVKSIPNATNAFREYVRVTLKLADAQSDLDKALIKQKAVQSEINQINDRYGDILDELNKKLQRNTQMFNDQNDLKKINAALTSGLLTEEEKARLEVKKKDIQLREQIRTVEDQRDAELEVQNAKMAVISAEMLAAQKRVDILKEQKESQEALIRSQIKYNNLIKEQASLLLKGAGGGDDDGLSLPVPAIQDLTDFMEDIEQFDFEGMFTAAQENINTLFDGIGEKFEGMGEELNEVKEAWNGFFGEAGSGAQMAADIVLIIGTIANLIRIFQDTQDTASRLIKAFQLLPLYIKIEIDKIINFFIGFKDFLVKVFTFIYNFLIGKSIIPDLMNGMKSIISGGLDFIKGKFIAVKDSVVGTVQNMASNIKSSITSSFQTAKSKASAFASDIRGIWAGLKNKLVDHSIVPDMMRDIEASISSGLNRSTDHMRAWATTAVKNTQMASQGIAGAVSIVQSQARQAVPQATIAQPSAVTNNRTTNVTVNANYQRQQSPADINMDVQAALVASQL